ncbi:MAG: DUF5110 domain-containing protein, partial [bacterium]|nr:DUF5110 domain-containing protein [bacterium]
MCSRQGRILTTWLGTGLLSVTAATGDVELAGRADQAAMMEVGQARVTVLTPTLLRLEWSADGVFEDRPSMFAVRRRLPVPQYAYRWDRKRVEIDTGRVRLTYQTDGGRFDASNLRIELVGDASHRQWHPGLENAGNLGGTVRTLDACRGPMDLGEGVLSRDGWYLLDDTTRLLLDGQPPWPTPRTDGDRLDWYFFGYGDDYATGLADLTAVGGPIPLPPRFAFGSWYSRYWPYTSDDFLAIADGYRQRGYPLDVMVIDMDWHLDGWTGYTWNRKLIPDPEALLAGLHERGLHVTLNLHPHSGVGPQERAYPDFARAMGVDPESKAPIPFDVADPRYMENYFKLLHHPLEAQGVDFWWVDWQQQRTSKIPGLDPLPWLNHLHFNDRGRQTTGRRELSFSRWGGWGDHRHPIQFSGDTESTWKVLKFLVPFTATAGNVGAAYWSHDLGGHWSDGGRISPELYARWLQLGAFTAAMRVHSTRDPENDRRPWIYGPEFERAAHAAYELRYRLLPYVYTMARKTYETGLPLCRPMYLHHPTEPEAYEVPGQFYFGDDLIVAAATEPGRGRTKVADVIVWLPEGPWYDLTTNIRYDGPGEFLIKVPLDRIPVFVRGGRPIPMQPPGKLNTAGPLEPLVIRIYPGPASETVLYEDDGKSAEYQQPGGFAKTRIAYRPESEDRAAEVIIEPREGTYRGMAGERSLLVEFGSALEPVTVTVDGEVAAQRDRDSFTVADVAEAIWSYARGLVVAVRTPKRPIDRRTTVGIQLPAHPQRLATARRVLAARAGFEENWRRQLDDEQLQKLGLKAGPCAVDVNDPESPQKLMRCLTAAQSELGLLEGPAVEALYGGAIREAG